MKFAIFALLFAATAVCVYAELLSGGDTSALGGSPLSVASAPVNRAVDRAQDEVDGATKGVPAGSTISGATDGGTNAAKDSTRTLPV